MEKIDLVYKYCNNDILKSLIDNNDLLSAYQFLYGEPDIKRIFGYDDKQLHKLSNGIKKVYHDNGTLWKEYTCKNNKLDGLYREWWNNVQLWVESIYKDGELDGLYRRWYENGQLWEECTYNDGELIIN